MTSSPARDTSAPYARMLERFRQRMVTDSRTLNETLRAIQQSGAAWPGRDALRSLAHQLAGLGGTFGFDEISDASSRLEETLISAADEWNQDRIETDIMGLLQQLDRASLRG